MMDIKKVSLRNCLAFSYEGNRSWFDIETCRTPLPLRERPEGWALDLRRRLKPFMICVATANGKDVELEVATSRNEAELIEWFREKSAGREMAYLSRDKFDKLVLEGKWTSRYRKRLVVGGGWPRIDEGEVNFYDLSREIKNFGSYEMRGDEIGGAEILKAAERWIDAEIELIARHCLRDVADLVAKDKTSGAKKGVFDRLFKNEIKWEG